MDESRSFNKNVGIALALVLALGLIVRFYLASLDLRAMLPNLLSDDFFCYMKLSKNIASGFGASFDGITKTNGFHPLYAILLAFMYSLKTYDLETPIRMALIVLSVFDALTGVLIYKIMLLPEFGSSRKSALVACLFWLLNPFVISGTFYAVETAMAVFFIALTVYHYLRIRRKDDDSKGYVILGLLLAFALLTRTDAIFLAIAIALDMLLQKKAWIMLVAMATMLLVSSPWFIWNYINFGMIQQQSGAILSYMNSFNAGSFLSASYIQYKMNLIYLSARIVAMFLSSMLLPVGFVFLIQFLKKVEVKLNYRKLLLNFITFFSLFLILFYPLLIGVTRRYYQPLLFVSALVIGFMFKDLTLLKDKKLQIIFVILLLVNFISVGLFYWFYRPVAPQAWHLDLYETAQWLNENTDPSDRVAGFNFATIAYFSNRTVIDIVGVMNDEAYHAMLDKKLFEYIRNRKIKYLVDNENSFDSMTPFMGDDNYKTHLKLVYRKPLKEQPDQYVVVYEVVE